MALNKNDINHIATVSRIAINNEEVEIFEKRINELLEIIKKIQTLDVANITPLINPISIICDFEIHLREDINIQRYSQEYMDTIIQNAPEFENNLFIVPKIIEQS